MFYTPLVRRLCRVQNTPAMRDCRGGRRDFVFLFAISISSRNRKMVCLLHTSTHFPSKRTKSGVAAAPVVLLVFRFLSKRR